MCLSLGETLDEPIRNIQTAVELYYDGENITVPPQASKIEDLITSDLYTKDGFWVLADIDFFFLSSKTVRINITLPEYKLSLIDKGGFQGPPFWLNVQSMRFKGELPERKIILPETR